MKLLAILNHSIDYLMKKGIELPRLQAEHLLSYVLELPRLQLYLQFERDLTRDEVSLMRHMLKRRAQHIPLQYILGDTNFNGLKISCTPSALIPRPETERLVELVIEKLSIFPTEELQTVYDVGTGTGAIALSLAKAFPMWNIIGTDVSTEALELAKLNHSHYPNFKVTFEQRNLLDGVEKPVLAVVSNLPYLTSEEMQRLPLEVHSEPKLALDGGQDGLDLMRKLIPQAAKIAQRLFLEIGSAQAQEITLIAQHAGYPFVTVVQDLTGRDRFIIAARS